jgi:endonuclease/exonuclease/phosphatase family metal-dependent hydrolase
MATGIALTRAFPSPPAMAPLQQSALRVMTFNLRIDCASDGQNAWPMRRDLGAGTIRFHQTDILGAQEASSSMIADMAERLPGYRWVGVGTADGLRAGACNPVFWRESRLELVRYQTRWLSPAPDVPGVGWDAEYPRTVTICEFRDRQSGQPLHVFNTHFDHVGETARSQSAQLVARWVSQLGKDACVVVLGDFNCTDDRGTMRCFCDSTGFQNARDISQTPHHGPTRTFTGFAGPQHGTECIDFIFVRGLHVQQHATLPDHADGRLPSDHFPVVAELLFP